ncbi:substrate-binding domain-containing protein, partial [Phytoactinopolyspora endophytica]|uniref:substrate-binding domain-containing protein n=1 Tax=Phytoactinopolyspora endophytica TaxID=1642495 RepID=UPI00197BA29C
NDHIALGFLHAVHEAGRSAPADVSVVGFDALPEAAHYVPPLTSVRQDFTALGRLGLNLLLEKIAGRMSSPERALLASELVVRSSTAPPART